MTGKRMAFLGLVLLAGVAPAAEKLPPVTQAERDLKEAPGEPSAPAVFLIQRGLIHLRNFAFQDHSSTIGVQARIKILKEEGKSRGEISIPHSDYVRLSKFEGRTIAPDGRVLKVDSKGKFKRRVSQASKRSVTSIAFPGVEVGAILEYEYELAFDNFYYVEPWYFMDEIPVLRSEVTWEVPNQLQSRVWTVPTFGVRVGTEQKGRSGYTEARFWADNLPSTPSEVYGRPFRDQAARLMVVPLAYKDEDLNVPLLDKWSSVCATIDESYVRIRRQVSQVAAKAQALTAGQPVETFPAILHRFVRDEIKTTYDAGPWVDGENTLDKVLAKGEAAGAEKALLLQAMLKAAQIDSKIVWAAEQSRGRVLPDLPNPGAFDRILVQISQPGGNGPFLDPVDRSLGAGRLAPGYEGTVALLHDPKTPETFTLPVTSFIAHQRNARLDLAVDADGRAAGKGEMLLKGHYAWAKSFPRRTAKETEEYWQKWADEAMPGYKITGITVADKPDDATLKVTWAMAATEESVLGDEVSLNPSRPLGPEKQPFTVGEAERRSPVMMDHGGSETVETHLSWPKGWSLATPPQPTYTDAGIAAYRVESTLDPSGLSLTVRRKLEIRKREPADRVEFAALRNLFTEAEKRDAQTLVLARR